jgi:amino acid transporter
MYSIDGLATSGNAPKIFLRTTKSGLPYVAVLFCASFSLLAFMAVSSGAGQVFIWFSNMTAVAGLMTWFGISVTYLRFYKGLKVQGIDRKTLPYSTRLQPYAAWYGTVSTIIVCFVRQLFMPNNTTWTDSCFTF